MVTHCSLEVRLGHLHAVGVLQQQAAEAEAGEGGSGGQHTVLTLRYRF